jgi:hypothetical protein
MVVFLGVQVVASQQAPEYFRDTQKNHWVYEGLAAAKKEGLIPGDLRFGNGGRHGLPPTSADIARLLPIIAKNFERLVKEQIDFRDVLVASAHDRTWNEIRDELLSIRRPTRSRKMLIPFLRRAPRFFATHLQQQGESVDELLSRMNYALALEKGLQVPSP